MRRKRSPPAGVLYVIGMPIGHPDDITIRAVRILRTIDVVASEDPSVTLPLLTWHRIRATLTSYGPRGIKEKVAVLIDRLQQGAHIALVSDCGSPVISDPGHLLVQAARAHGIRVLSVPGPSALTAAMSVAGISADAFYFHGNLPSSSAALRRAISQLLGFQAPTISFVPAAAASNVLRLLAELAPRRSIVFACNLTGLDEWIARGTPSRVQRMLTEAPHLDKLTLIVRGRGRLRYKGPTKGGGSALATHCLPVG